jgi:hypothetical protein
MWRSILICVSDEPLQLWNKSFEGDIRFVSDEDLQSDVLELLDTENLIGKCFISCPQHKSLTLGITLPVVMMIIKNVCKTI